MYHHPIKDEFVRAKIRGQINTLKKLHDVGEEKFIPHKPIGGNRRIGKKHRKIIEDYHQLSEEYNFQKEIGLVTLELTIELFDLLLNLKPIKKYSSN